MLHESLLLFGPWLPHSQNREVRLAPKFCQAEKKIAREQAQVLRNAARTNGTSILWCCVQDGSLPEGSKSISKSNVDVPVLMGGGAQREEAIPVVVDERKNGHQFFPSGL